MPIQLSGSLVITGSITTTGVIIMSGSIASASYSSTSDLLQGTGSVGFTTTASFNAVSSSQQQISASYIALSASYNTFSGSASTRITANSSSIQQVSSSQQQISASLLNVIAIGATTGSNSFRADQSITGSLVVSSTITAQTLVVQTVTSSIVYSSGSNIFGSALADKQTFTGSIAITGSIGIGTTPEADFPLKLRGGGSTRIKLESPSTQVSALDFYKDSLALWSMVVDNTQTYAKIENRALNIDAIRFYSSSNNVILTPTTGNVGIGTTNPTQKVEIQAPANLWATRFIGANVASQSYGFYVDAGTNATDTNAMFRSNGGSSVYLYIGGNGKVGVGTSSPDRLLTVNGDSNLLGNNYISTSKFFQWEGGAYWTTRVTSTGNQFEIYRGDTGASPFTISNTNAVRVSNNTQTDDLGLIQIYNTATNAGDNTSLTVKSYSGTGQFMQWENYGMRIGSRIKTNTGAGGIYFTYGNDSVGMTITSGGQVNVNSTQTTYPFYVQAALGNWTAVFENTTSGASGILMRSTGGSQGFYYGAYDGGAYKFFVNGSGVVNSTSTSITIISSDAKLKTDIRDYNKGLAEVLAMKPRIYKRKDNLESDEVGFIAQEMDIALAGSMIESYKDEEGEPIHTYQLEWYPLLVKAIQELSAKVTALETK